MSTHPRRRALLVAINYTGEESELKGCRNDADHLVQYLLTRGWTRDEIVMVTDDPGCPLKPNKAVIMDELIKLVKSDAKIQFFAYSGHGTSRKDVNGDEKDGKDEALCALDFTITDDQLKEVLMLAASDVDFFALFDSCHSGTCLDLKYIVSYAPKIDKLTIATNPKDKLTYASTVFISGCQDLQTSADTVEDGQPQGAMTWAFLKAMKDLGSHATKEKILVKMLTLLQGKYEQLPQMSFGRKITLSSPIIL